MCSCSLQDTWLPAAWMILSPKIIELGLIGEHLLIRIADEQIFAKHSSASSSDTSSSSWCSKNTAEWPVVSDLALGWQQHQAGGHTHTSLVNVAIQTVLNIDQAVVYNIFCGYHCEVARDYFRNWKINYRKFGTPVGSGQIICSSLWSSNTSSAVQAFLWQPMPCLWNHSLHFHIVSSFCCDQVQRTGDLCLKNLSCIWLAFWVRISW